MNLKNPGLYFDLLFAVMKLGKSVFMTFSVLIQQKLPQEPFKG